MKKVTSILILTCLLFLSLSFTISATANSESYTVDSTRSSLSKSQFADACEEQYTDEVEHKSLSDEEVSNLILLYRQSGDLKYEQELNNAGIYLYSSSTSYVSTNARTSEPTDVIMNTCEVLYNITKDQWIVKFIGNWKSIDPISDEVHVWFNPSEGDTMNVGGYDAVGMVFYDTSGGSPKKIDSYATIRSSDTVTSSTSKNPDTYDDSYGVIFRIQDYIICRKNTSIFTYEWDYVGAIFETSMTFDSSFENFNGKAKGLYVHTWKSSSVTSIGVGWINFDLSWVPEDYSFSCYSNTAVEF